MKLNTLLFFLLLLMYSCQQPTYTYIDKSTLIVFNKYDTLVYKGATSTDTFAVSSIDRYMENSDKINNTETLIIKIPELTKNCDSHCNGIYIKRQDWVTVVSFRNIDHNVYNSSPTISYTIGTRTFNKVYLFTTAIDLSDKKNIKAIYYTHKYGIIAYELASGEKVELQEKYLKP